MTPKTATPLELRPNPDGSSTPWHEGYALTDFDSGEPIVIPVGTTNRAALDLVRPALGKSTKFFKVEADAPASVPAKPSTGAADANGKVRTALGGSAPEGSPVLQTSGTDRPRPDGSLHGAGNAEPPSTAAGIKANGPVEAVASEEETPAPAPSINAATMPEDEITRYAGQMVDIPVAVGDSGKTATLTMDAAAAVRDVQSRLAAARSLLGCLK